MTTAIKQEEDNQHTMEIGSVSQHQPIHESDHKSLNELSMADAE